MASGNALYEAIGERIRRLREAHGLSQEALAKALGVAANTISRWETAVYKPKLDELERLAQHFSVSILDFLPDDERPSESNKIRPLMRAAQNLSKEDILRVTQFAEFVAMRDQLRKNRKTK